jgi:hypothetical protein
VNVLIRSELGGFLGLSAVVGIGACAALAVVGIAGGSRHARRISMVLVSAVLFATVLSLAGLGLMANTTRPDLAQGAGDARDAITQLNEADYEAAAELFASASDAFERSDSRLSGIVVAPSHLVPVVAQNVRAGADLSTAGASGKAAAAAALRAIAPALLSVVDGAIDLAAIAAVQEPLLQVEAVLNDLDERLTSNEPGLQNALDAVRLAPQMLGGDGLRRYLVLFTTPVEARGLTGFVGNYAVVTADEGRIEVRIVRRWRREVLSKSSRVDRCRGDNHLQVGPLRQQLFEVAEDEVDVQAALMRLVDDQRVIPAQHPITLDLGQQDAVGHHLDQRPLAHLIGEAHGVANVVTKLRSEFVGNALANRPSRHATGLSVPNQAGHPAPRFQAQLRDLSALARTSLASNNHNLMLSNHLEEFVVTFGNRERFGVLQSLFSDDRRSSQGATFRIPSRPFWSRTFRSRRQGRQPGSSSANCHPKGRKHRQVRRPCTDMPAVKQPFAIDRHMA